MMARVLVPLLLAAGVNPALAKSKPRNWQTGEVTRVERPAEGRLPASGTLAYNVEGSTPVMVRESSSFGAKWAVAIALPDAFYVVTLPPPPRKSSLAKLKAGFRLECAVESKTMYLKDEKGTVFRAKISARSDPGAGFKD